MKANCTFRSATVKKFMPVRIYDISKKLGLENKEILAKAKALGIAAAKVPSSSLDKITAEWLEEEILKDSSRNRRPARAQARAGTAQARARRGKNRPHHRRRRRNPNRPHRNAKAEPAVGGTKSEAGDSVMPPVRRSAETVRARSSAATAQTGRPASRRQSRIHSIAARVRSRTPARKIAAARQTAAAATRRTAATRRQRGDSRRRFPARPRRPPAPSTAASRPNPPRRQRPNLSRRTTARSSSSSRRLSCANWPSSSSKSRSTSSPI